MMNCNYRGSALLVILLILMVMSILGVTMLNMTVVHLRIGTADRFHQAAYYYAEAGLQHQIEVMSNYMEYLYRENTISSNRNDFYKSMVYTPVEVLSFEQYEGQQVDMEITNKYEGLVNDAACFTIYSSCSIGKIKRTLKARIDVQWRNPEESTFGLYKSNFLVSRWGETYDKDI